MQRQTLSMNRCPSSWEKKQGNIFYVEIVRIPAFRKKRADICTAEVEMCYMLRCKVDTEKKQFSRGIDLH
jgi:hypothetical protein